MSLQKGFLRGADIKIDRWLIVTGILLSAIISFCFYAFFIYLSEVFRSILLEFTSSLLLLEESDVSFYGYSLAFLASVIGQGFGLRLILSAINRNRQFKSRFGLRVNMHNIRFTLWLWLFWVCDWLCMMGIVSSSFEVHYDLDIKAELGYLFFLLPLVWFLTYWLQTYRIFHKKKRLQWIIGASLYLCVSTLIIGNIRLLDYEQLNEQYSSTFPEYKYEMQVAESRTQARVRRVASSTKIYLIWDGHEAKAVFSEFEPISFTLQDATITNRIRSIKESFTEVERDNIKFIITADTRIPTSSLLAFEQILSGNGIHQVIYRTSVENSKYPWHYPSFQRTGVPKRLGPDCSAAIQNLDSLRKAGYTAKQIKWPNFGCYWLSNLTQENRVLVKSDSNGLTLNGKSVNEYELLSTLTKLVHKYPGKLNILYQPDPNTTFAQYLKGKDLILQSYIINRKRFALEEYDLEYKYGNPYYDPRHSKQDTRIKRAYPMSTLELTGWNLEFYEYLKE